MNQILLNNQGTPVEEIVNDIESILRNVSQPDLGAKEYNPCQPDAGINGINDPISPVTQGIQEVKVILQNQGSGNLSSAIINWKVNGTLQKPYAWTGNLAVRENEEVGIGSFDFKSGKSSIQAWTSKPNGLDECNLYNDSTFSELAGALCGTYTVGGSGADFATFSEAVSVLNTAGISCPVIFKVRNGMYNEQFVIKAIQGSSPTNTVTFQSESGDSTKVVVQYGGWPNITVQLKNAGYINFRGIGINGYQGLIFAERTHHINVEHCNLMGDNQVLGINTGSHDIKISSSVLFGAEYAISLDNAKDIQIWDNVLNEQTGRAIYGSSSRNIVIEENRFNKIQTGVVLHYCINSVIRNNRFNILTQPGRENTGVYLSYSDSLSACNNYINTVGNTPGIGMKMDNSSHTGIYFNSLNIANTDIGQQSQGLWMQTGDQNNIKNNIFNIKTVGTPVLIMPGTTGFSLDYNDYYSPSGLIGQYADINYKDLQVWRQTTGQDSHSLSENPFYTSITNFRHPRPISDNQHNMEQLS